MYGLQPYHVYIIRITILVVYSNESTNGVQYLDGRAEAWVDTIYSKG